jgi:predicted nucleic acid-binding protein
MILLDTNVVSEAMTREPHPRVRGWLDSQAANTLFLTSITVAELLFGVGALPTGKRKDTLAAALDDVLDLFAPASCPSMPQRRGAMPISPSRHTRPERLPTPDGYIAAIAAVHGFAVATRDASAFNAAGLTVIDPWTSAAG